MNPISAMATRLYLSLLPQGTPPSIPDEETKDVNEILEEGASSFGVVQTFFTVIGIVIVFFTLWRVIKNLAMAKGVEAAKAFAFGLVAAVFCFNIDLPLSLIETLGGVFKSAFESIGNLAD